MTEDKDFKRGSLRHALAWSAGASLVLLSSACGSDGELAGPKRAPESERVVLRYLQRPASVLGWGSPRFTPDGSGVSFTFAHRDDPGRRDIGVLSLDTGDFRCLTCGMPRSAGSHLWFPDRRRLLIYYFGILTDNFFVFDLDQPNRFHRIDGVKTNEITHDRFPVLSPDGRRLAWTKVRMDGFHLVISDLLRESGGYRVVNVRHLYPPPVTGQGDLEGWSRAHAWYEAKSFTDGEKPWYSRLRETRPPMWTFT